MRYGDNSQAKFVFVTYFPENLSQIARAKANPHKTIVDRFVKVLVIHPIFMELSCAHIHFRIIIFKSLQLPQKRLERM